LDEKDFDKIYTDFQPKIYQYLIRLVGRNDAEDLTQAVFTRVSLALDQFRGESRLSTWIYRIATNLATDSLRLPALRLRDKQVSFDQDTEIKSISTESLNMEQQIIRREMNQCIRSLIENLPVNYRTVIVLNELEGFKNSEIAQILDTSLHTVKIRLHRARTKLKKEMINQCDFYWDERNELSCDPKREIKEL
jgi:RNA polymerase sigma-70 factor (ECF subfamily)